MQRVGRGHKVLKRSIRTSRSSREAGCLENFLHCGGCYRFEMHPISQVLNPPGESIDSELSSPLVKIVSPQLAVRCIAREHVKDTPHDRVCHGDDRPLLAPAHRKTLIQRGEIRVLRTHSRMGKLGQDRPEGSIALAGFARALLPSTLVVARGYTGPRS